MSDSLELTKTKVSIRWFAENLELSDAEKYLRSLRETVAYLERRTTRERMLLHKQSESIIVTAETAMVSLKM